MIAFDPQLAVFNLEGGQEIDKLEVLVAHQFLEYLVTKGFIDEYVRFFEVREQYDVHLFGSPADFDEVDYSADIVEVTVEHLPLLVTSSK